MIFSYDMMIDNIKARFSEKNHAFNPNWHEGRYFYLLVLFGSAEFPNFFGGEN